MFAGPNGFPLVERLCTTFLNSRWPTQVHFNFAERRLLPVNEKRAGDNALSEYSAQVTHNSVSLSRNVDWLRLFLDRCMCEFRQEFVVGTHLTHPDQ